MVFEHFHKTRLLPEKEWRDSARTSYESSTGANILVSTRRVKEKATAEQSKGDGEVSR
jgi:hypothetical protein